MSSIRISIPDTAKAGEIIEIKTLIQHPMESGFRRDARGQVIPRNIITDFVCTYDGDTVFQASVFPSTSANPFLSFFTRADQSGTIVFTWTEDTGETWTETRKITVS